MEARQSDELVCDWQLPLSPLSFIAMSHSVERHLSVNPAQYDVEIRRFIPGYDAMLEEVTSALTEQLGADARAPHILDLGAGTGSLSEHVLQRLPGARLTLIDADPAMLAQARLRLAEMRDRIAISERSFTDPLPACEAAVAALALHHVHDSASKQVLYGNIHRALSDSGVLVIADAMLPETGPLAAPLRRRWAEHLCAQGDTMEAAYGRFAAWAEEDRYFGIDDELRALAASGFGAVDVRWRLGPTAVVVACKV